MAVVIAAPLSQQLQPKFIGLRSLYNARERPSRMYSWPVFVASAIIVEMPYNIVWCVCPSPLSRLVAVSSPT